MENASIKTRIQDNYSTLLIFSG